MANGEEYNVSLRYRAILKYKKMKEFCYTVKPSLEGYDVDGVRKHIHYNKHCSLML